MNRNRLLVLGLGATSIGAACLVACGDAERRLVPAEELDQERPEASLPPEGDADLGVIVDAGPDDADAETPMPDVDLSDEPVACAATPCVVQLVGAASHFCALMSDATIQCWGRAYRGSLGRGPDAGSSPSLPAPVVGIADATQIASSATVSSTCARLADERVLCWGDNANAQLGLTAPAATLDSLDHHTPTEIAVSVPLAHVAIGQLNGCAVAADGGDLYCWGNNAQQVLGRPDAATTGNLAYQGPALADRRDLELTRLAVGYRTAFGVTADGGLVSWGAMSGRQSSLSHTLPMLHATPDDVVSVSSAGRQATEAATCVVARGRLYCWGRNTQGILGTGLPDDERLPAEAIIEAKEGSFAQQVAVSTMHACVRMTDGTVACSGSNTYGQLGAPSTVTSSATFIRVALQGHAVRIASSANAVCALLKTGEVHCWGGNTFGELGRGTVDSTITPHPEPVKVVFQ